MFSTVSSFMILFDSSVYLREKNQTMNFLKSLAFGIHTAQNVTYLQNIDIERKV